MLFRILSIAVLAFTLAAPGVSFAGQNDTPTITVGSPKKGDPDKKHKKHKKGAKKHGKKKGKKGKKGRKGAKKTKKTRKGDRRGNHNRRFK